MAYFPDLSPYQYIPVTDDDCIPTLNVGWLARTKPYSQGETPDSFQERLFDFCQEENATHFCMGYHQCPFCKEPPFVLQAKRGGKVASLGNGEIRVIGAKATYAAPTLIYHYVVAHHYLPPEEFVAAVLTGPLPGSKEHQALLKKIDERVLLSARNG